MNLKYLQTYYTKQRKTELNLQATAYALGLIYIMTTIIFASTNVRVLVTKVATSTENIYTDVELDLRFLIFSILKN